MAKPIRLYAAIKSELSGMDFEVTRPMGLNHKPIKGYRVRCNGKTMTITARYQIALLK